MSTDHNLFEQKGEPKRNRAEALDLVLPTSLTNALPLDQTGSQNGTGLVEVSLYVHRNRRLIRDGSPGRPPRLPTQLLISDGTGVEFLLLNAHGGEKAY